MYHPVVPGTCSRYHVTTELIPACQSFQCKQECLYMIQYCMDLSPHNHLLKGLEQWSDCRRQHRNCARKFLREVNLYNLFNIFLVNVAIMLVDFQGDPVDNSKYWHDIFCLEEHWMRSRILYCAQDTRFLSWPTSSARTHIWMAIWPTAGYINASLSSLQSSCVSMMKSTAVLGEVFVHDTCDVGVDLRPIGILWLW